MSKETKIRSAAAARNRLIMRRRLAAVIIGITVIVLVVLLIVNIITSAVSGTKYNYDGYARIDVPEESETVSESSEIQPVSAKMEHPECSSALKSFSYDTIDAPYAVLIDVDNNKILAGRYPESTIYPASMTKVMTLVVAVENTTDFERKFALSYDLVNPLVNEDATRAGFDVGEEVSVNDMLYGLILPSGADAAVGLANVISGSEEEFVKLMNAKCDELGLKDTHFSNTSGLHSTANYTTPTEMAMIMAYAMKNPKCREVLSTYQYTTARTPQHPEGILLTSTMFSRMKGDEVEGVSIIAGKTGYTDQARHTLVSYAEKNGRGYVAVTAYGSTKWKSIYDAFEIYTTYLP